MFDKNNNRVSQWLTTEKAWNLIRFSSFLPKCVLGKRGQSRKWGKASFLDFAHFPDTYPPTIIRANFELIVRVHIGRQADRWLQYISTSPAFLQISHFLLWGLTRSSIRNLLHIQRVKSFRAARPALPGPGYTERSPLASFICTFWGHN